MTKNVGALDRVIRLGFAVVVGLLYWQGIISGGWAIGLGTLAVVFAATSFISFCPIYAVVGWRTVRDKVLNRS